MILCLGSESGDHIIARMRSAENSGGYWWLDCDVDVSAGAFPGCFTANFLASDFPPFRKQLQLLYDQLWGEASFATLEGQLEFRLVGDARGHLAVGGTAVFLPRAIAEIEQFERESLECRNDASGGTA